ncbi:hypothetical protein CHUAL_013240 [Chamberlinius hualienensis]
MRSLLANLIIVMRFDARKSVITSAFLKRQICRQYCSGKSLMFCSSLQPTNSNKLAIATSQRYKSDRGRKRETVKEEDDTNEDDYSTLDSEDTTKIATVHVPSLRVDAILKAAFGLARNKVDSGFFQNRVYVNGELIQKKHRSVMQYLIHFNSSNHTKRS